MRKRKNNTVPIITGITVLLIFILVGAYLFSKKSSILTPEIALSVLVKNDPVYKNAKVEIVKQVEGFANVGIHFRGGSGSYAVMQFKNNNWKVLYGGQDYSLCENVVSLDVPKEIYGKCYDCPINSGENCSSDDLK